MARRKLLYVEWDDHSSHSQTWVSEPHLKNGTRGLKCSSVGWLIEENEEAITLAATRDNGRTEHFSGDQTIMKSCIRKRRILRHKE